MTADGQTGKNAAGSGCFACFLPFAGQPPADRNSGKGTSASSTSASAAEQNSTTALSASASAAEQIQLLVQETMKKEVARIHDHITQEMRQFEVSVAMQAQLMNQPSPISRRRSSDGLSEVDNLRMQMMHLQQKTRRRKQQVGQLRKQMQQVRNLFMNDMDDEDNGSFAASHLLSEIRAERERWNAEKRMLEQEIRKHEEFINENEGKPKEKDPEKESLKKCLKQLQMTIESKDHYACWVCNQESVRASWGDGDGEWEEQPCQQKVELQEEVEELRGKIAEMHKELRHYRDVTISDDVITEAISPIGRRKSRDRIATPFFSDDEAAIDTELDEGSSSPRVQIVEAPVSVTEVVPDPGSQFRTSRGRINTPFITAEAFRAHPDSPHSSGKSVQFSPDEERPENSVQFDMAPTVLDAASVIAPGQQLRPSRKRTPTGFVQPTDERVEFAESPDVHESAVAAGGELKPLRSRHPTPYVIEEDRLPDSPTIHFDHRQSYGTAASASPEEGEAKSVRGRIPTGHPGVDTSSNSIGGVWFDEKPDITNVPAAAAGSMNSTRDRIPTGFVSGDAGEEEGTVQIDLRPSIGSAASYASEGGGKSLRDRVPTGHVPNADVQAIHFNSQDSLISPRDENGELGEIKPARDRVPTAFAPKTAADSRLIRFADEPGSTSGMEGKLVQDAITPADAGCDSKRSEQSETSVDAPSRSRASSQSSARSENADDVSDTETVSSHTSRSSRSRQDTPFLSAFQMGFEYTGQEEFSDVSPNVPGSEIPSREISSRTTSRMSVVSNPESTRSSFMSKQDSGTSSSSRRDRRNSDPDASVKRRTGQNSEGYGERRKLVKQVSIESHCEREITKAVRRSIQQRARQDRSQRSNKPGQQLPSQAQGWARVRKVVDEKGTMTKTRSLSLDDSSPEQDIETRLVEDADKDVGLLKEALLDIDIFHGLDEDSLLCLIKTMNVYSYGVGENAVRQGDSEGSHFFVVAQGEFVVVKDGQVRATLGVGKSFGESALLLFGERSATVRATCQSRAYAIEGMLVRDMLRTRYEQKHEPTTLAVDDVLASGEVEILSKLNDFQLQSLYDKADVEDFEEGDEIMQEGQQTIDRLYVILNGTVSVMAKGQEIQRLEAYSILGERGMLFNEVPHTIVALEDGGVQCLVLTRDLLEDIFGEHLNKVLVKNRIMVFLQRHEIFARLHEDQRDAVARCCSVTSLKPGEELDGKDVRFVAVLYGEVATSPHEAIPGDGSPVSPFSASPSGRINFRRYSGTRNECFGEEHLLRRNLKWDIHVRCVGESVAKLAVWRTEAIDQVLTFDNLDWGLEQEKKVRTLRSVFVFRTLSKLQLWQLASNLEIQHVKNGETIIREGELGADFYVVRKGLFSVYKDNKKVRNCALDDYFGERALLHNEARSATIKADEDSEVWRIDKTTFEKTMNKQIVDHLKERIALQDTAVTFADLEFVRVVGRGGFGIVKMVQSTKTGVRYALKCVRKKDVVEKAQQESLVSERSILAEVDHPFVIKFVRSFKSTRFVYFLTELVSGGELLDALDILGLLNPTQAAFYTASISQAIQFLHSRRIAYLDLKSENCMIDHQGFLKIIDFGIAQRITSGRCHVVKGTPMFMAPEMIMMKGYNTTADLWSLGICLYEFVIGEFPFGNNFTNTVDIFQEVVRAELKFPEWFEKKSENKDTIALIRGLLIRDPLKRLGVGANGYQSFQEHPFFKSFNWDDLLARKLNPPHKPKAETYAEDKTDKSNAASTKTSLEEEENRANAEVDDGWTDPDPGWDVDF